MSRESTKLWPNTNEAQGVRTKLTAIIESLHEEVAKLGVQSLLDHPREYVIEGKIEFLQLRKLQALEDLEIGISGNKGNLVLNTGDPMNVSPYLGEYSATKNKNVTVDDRFLNADYHLHMHIINPLHRNDFAESMKKQGLLFDTDMFPSEFDFDTFGRLTKRKDSILVTRFGVVHFTGYPNFEQNLNKWLIQNQEKFEKENINYKMALEMFIRQNNLIIEEATWEEPEKGQKIIDTYFDQN